MADTWHAGTLSDRQDASMQTASKQPWHLQQPQNTRNPQTPSSATTAHVNKACNRAKLICNRATGRQSLVDVGALN